MGDRATKLVKDHVDDESIQKVKQMADDASEAGEEIFDDLVTKMEEQEVTLTTGPTDSTKKPSVKLLTEEDITIDTSGKSIPVNINNIDQLRAIIERECIVNKTLNLSLQFKCPNEKKKADIIKKLQHFFYCIYVYKDTVLVSTKEGLTITGTWDSSVYMAKAYHGKYPMDKLTDLEKEAVLLLRDIIPDLIKGKKNDYEKAVALHDWVVLNVKYLKEGLHQNGEYAAVKGNAICTGYARLYSTMLECANIPACITIGNIHAWNMVKVDGNWMHVDVTWNDRGDTEDKIGYVFFGLNHEEMTLVHSDLAATYKYLPACKNPNLSYAKVYYTRARNFNDVTKILCKKKPDKYGRINICFTKKVSKEQFTKALAKAKQRGNKYGSISTWSYEDTIKRSAFVQFDLKDSSK